MCPTHKKEAGANQVRHKKVHTDIRQLQGSILLYKKVQHTRTHRVSKHTEWNEPSYLSEKPPWVACFCATMMNRNKLSAPQLQHLPIA